MNGGSTKDFMRNYFLPMAVFAVASFQVIFPLQARAGDEKLRVLIVTGGHDYEKASFETMFRSFEGMECQFVAHPKAHERFKSENAGQYDAVVLYDMWGSITPEAQKDFQTLFQNGKGLVALHHCLAGYQKWGEYKEIIGGMYHETKWVQNGVEKPASTYKHDVHFTVQIADPTHPVTRGLKDFEIVDETYGGFEVLAKSKPLLTTTEPTSGKTVAWTSDYGKTHAVYIALGHDHQAYEKPHFRTLVRQAIRWTVSPTN
jgi:hypothetical protein